MTSDTLSATSADILNQHGDINAVVDRCLDLAYLLGFALRYLVLV